MKLDFAWANDGACHEYCLVCKAEAVRAVRRGGQESWHCSHCKRTSPRAIIIDPAIKWWRAPDGEYWHESAGVFVRDPRGRFLFFRRTKFPSGLTVPAGHRDQNETPLVAAIRELEEEVGLRARHLTAIATDDIMGDSCRRGSDVHHWNSFLLTVNRIMKVTVREEGTSPVWLSLEQARQTDLMYATRYVIGRHHRALLAG